MSFCLAVLKIQTHKKLKVTLTSQYKFSGYAPFSSDKTTEKQQLNCENYLSTFSYCLFSALRVWKCFVLPKCMMQCMSKWMGAYANEGRVHFVSEYLGVCEA